MNDLKQNEQMELLLKAKQNQPDLYSKLPAATKISLGIYETTKKPTNGLTAEAKLLLAGLKKSIAQDNLSAFERTTLALKISELEKNK
jgi:hypothetical protein